MSKQKELHRGTISGEAGRLQRTILAVELGKCSITCSKCYCSIIHLEKLSIKCNSQSHSWELRTKPSKISSPLFYSIDNQDGLCNLLILLKSAGKCLLHSAIKARAPAGAAWHECQTHIPVWRGCQTGRSTHLNATAWDGWVQCHGSVRREPKESNKENSGAQKILQSLNVWILTI